VDGEVEKGLRRFFRANFEKIDSLLRRLSIFSKFALSSVANDKFWWLLFIGSLTGSGNAGQRKRIWAVECL
jgi:hypothetical protein